MATKPSFFQKLTGANEEKDEVKGNEEETGNIEMEKSSVPAQEIKSSEPDASQEIETEQSAQAPPALDEKKPVKPKTRVKKMEPITKNSAEPIKNTAINFEDWTPESEGQLTIDVYQTPSDIVIKSTVAGVNPDEIDIAISNDMVTIKGFRKKDEEVKTEDYYYQECYWGAFSRSVILPVDVETDKVEAGIKNGVLTIRLPKIEKIKTKKIKVKAG